MAVSTKQIASGFGWVFFTNTLNRLFGFGTTLVLAKLLAPEHFGLVAAAEAMTAILKTFRDLGVGQALIYTPRTDNHTYHTAFVMTLLLSITLFALAAVFAPFMASFLEEPSLTPVLLVMSSSIMALTLRTVPDALLRKDIAFKKMVLPDLLSVIVASAVGIYLALNGYGVWSLVIRTLVFYWMGTILLWYVCDYKPRIYFDRPIATELFHYSKFVVGSTVIVMALHNIDRIFVSKLEGMASLGIYTLAGALANMPVSEVGHLVCRVIFPVFSKIKDDAAKLQQYLLNAISAQSFVTIPMAVGLLIFGPSLAGLIFEEKWQGLGDALQVLALAAIFRAISSILHEMLRATGDPRSVQSVMAFRLGLLCVFGYPSIILGGLIGFCWLNVASASSALVIELLMVRKKIGAKPTLILAVLVPPSLVSLFTIGSSYWMMVHVSPSRTLLPTLAFALLAAVLYVSAMTVVDRKRLVLLTQALRK